MSEVVLRPVDEQVLARLVRAAVDDTAADEVTPPVTPGAAWTPERLDWLQRFHRDRRAGLAGPLAEVTWAVVEGDAVLGSVRLRRTGDGELETGVWLTRGGRGRGIGSEALRAVLDQARVAGAPAVVADTTAGNAAACALLTGLGFALAIDGGAVRARRGLSGSC